MGILSKVSEGRDPAAGTVSSVICDDEVKVFLMKEGRHLIIIAHHFAISVKEQDPGSMVVAHVETAYDANTFPNPDREVKGILRAGGKFLPRVEDVL
jgi:hypothetical protein